MKRQWLAWFVCAWSAWFAACAGPSKQQLAAQRAADARARRARMAQEREEREQASAEREAEERANHPLARAVAAQQAAAEAEASGAQAPAAKLSERDHQGEQHDKKVGVQGIEGTLSNFDVRVTMEKQAKAFGKCHEPRARKVPVLGGNIEFRIHVLADGTVSDVNVPQSDLGDRVLERCMSDVIHNSKFPQPHGGEANVTWNMSLEPRRGRHAEQWEEERVDRLVKKHGDDLLETCSAERHGPYNVTAYVNKRGKVLAAGVAAAKDSAQDAFDCIADELKSWHMPRPRKGVAKVSFPLKG